MPTAISLFSVNSNLYYVQPEDGLIQDVRRLLDHSLLENALRKPSPGVSLYCNKQIVLKK